MTELIRDGRKESQMILQNTDGILEDISGIIEPAKARFAPNTVETTYLYNDKTKAKV